MNDRERVKAILSYQPYDRLPLVHFGYWDDTVVKWANEGHIAIDLARAWKDNNEADFAISGKLGFDFNWHVNFGANLNLYPAIETRVIEQFPDGSYSMLDANGAIILKKPGVTSIPKEIDHLFKGRKEWDEIYKPRLQWSAERLTTASIRRAPAVPQPGHPATDSWLAPERSTLMGIWCGSLFGYIRDWIGVVNLSYLTADDPDLLFEMIDTVGELAYQGVQAALATGVQFDFGHFWEDICFKSGPLVNPRLFAAHVGPHYRRITSLLKQHGITVVSLDCDGLIDALVPIWLENGVNTMFPIEVGVWDASIGPWRDKYGKGLLGVGGMNKVVFSRDYAAVDAEIARLRPLVELGGFIPCPDHRLAPDAKWENVQYYCERMRTIFGG